MTRAELVAKLEAAEGRCWQCGALKYEDCRRPGTLPCIEGELIAKFAAALKAGEKE